jgi:signal peptidase I
MTDKGKRNFKEFLSYLIVIIIAAGLSLVFRIFLFEPYIVPTSSMENTLNISDRVIVNKVAYLFNDIRRGDVIVFHSPTEPGKDLVKRAIAFEGEEVTFTSEGLMVGDLSIVEDYIPDDYDYETMSIVIGENQIFALGDNRANSYDSRNFGPIDKDLVFGKVLFIYWPPPRMSLVR